MVGHLLEYHPAITRLQELVEQRELGRLEYIYSNRLNLEKSGGRRMRSGALRPTTSP